MKIIRFLVTAIWLWIGPATLAAGVVGLIIALLSFLAHWTWLGWLLLSPTLYLVWLVSFLGLCTATMRRVGRKRRKPRFLKLPGGDPRETTIVLMCSMRNAIVSSLPLAVAVAQSPWGRRLVMGSYAPSVNVADGVQILGSLRDPDLTEVGPRTVIGGAALVAAHAWTALPNGKLAYVTAPVKIGARVTVGGGALISYGCVIGDDAVIEPLSYVAPNTEIPPGEIWGGSPATFQRKRPGVGPAGGAAQDGVTSFNGTAG